MATPVRRIVNASPLILLAKAGQLDLLRAGVPEIIVSDAVLREVGARGPADRVLLEIHRGPGTGTGPGTATQLESTTKSIPVPRDGGGWALPRRVGRS